MIHFSFTFFFLLLLQRNFFLLRLCHQTSATKLRLLQGTVCKFDLILATLSVLTSVAAPSTTCLFSVNGCCLPNFLNFFCIFCKLYCILFCLFCTFCMSPCAVLFRSSHFSYPDYRIAYEKNKTAWLVTYRTLLETPKALLLLLVTSLVYHCCTRIGVTDFNKYKKGSDYRYACPDKRVSLSFKRCGSRGVL